MNKRKDFLDLLERLDLEIPFGGLTGRYVAIRRDPGGWAIWDRRPKLVCIETDYLEARRKLKELGASE